MAAAPCSGTSVADTGRFVSTAIDDDDDAAAALDLLSGKASVLLKAFANEKPGGIEMYIIER